MNGVAVAMILVHQEHWVAPAVVLVSICAAMVAVQQYEDRLLRTNNAIVTLDAILCDWNTLDDGDQIKQELIDRSVARTESVVTATTLGEDTADAEANTTTTTAKTRKSNIIMIKAIGTNG